jgi:hypothetical protein
MPVTSRETEDALQEIKFRSNSVAARKQDLAAGLFIP